MASRLYAFAIPGFQAAEEDAPAAAVDRREQILARLHVVLTGLAGVVSTYRNNLDIPDHAPRRNRHANAIPSA